LSAGDRLHASSDGVGRVIFERIEPLEPKESERVAD